MRKSLLLFPLSIILCVAGGWLALWQATIDVSTGTLVQTYLIQPEQPLELTLDPAMNPYRLDLWVSYERPREMPDSEIQLLATMKHAGTELWRKEHTLPLKQEYRQSSPPFQLATLRAILPADIKTAGKFTFLLSLAEIPDDVNIVKSEVRLFRNRTAGNSNLIIAGIVMVVVGVLTIVGLIVLLFLGKRLPGDVDAHTSLPSEADLESLRSPSFSRHKPRKIWFATLACSILMILGGTAVAILYPLLTYQEGESIDAGKIQLGKSTAIALDKSMNPLRCRVDFLLDRERYVQFDRTHVYFLDVTLDDERIARNRVSFSLEREVEPVYRTTLQPSYEIPRAISFRLPNIQREASYKFTLYPESTGHEIDVKSIGLQLTRNTQPINITVLVVAIVVGVVGIFGTLLSALLLAGILGRSKA